MLLDGSFRVLIVDDMPAMRGILRDMLEKMGLSQIHEAEDGEVAWEFLLASTMEGDRVNLVICDWRLNGMTGVDLLRAVRSSQAYRELPFLMVTAQSQLTHLDEALRAGASGYLVKPFSVDALHEQLMKLANTL